MIDLRNKCENKLQLLDLIDQLEDDLQFMKELRDHISDIIDDNIVDDENSKLAHKSNNKTISQLTYEYFTHCDNKWSTIKEIREKLQTNRGCVANVLYASRKELYENKPNPNHKRAKLWRLKIGPNN